MFLPSVGGRFIFGNFQTLYMEKKRGQISLFLIVALVITLTVAVTLNVVNRGQTDTLESEGLLSGQEVNVDPGAFRSGVEQCVGDIGKELATSLTFLGGSFSRVVYDPVTPFSNTGVRFKGVDYRYLCKHASGRGCVSELITRQDMITALNDKIRDQAVSRCFNFGPFIDAGFEVETGELSISSGIVSDSVNIKIVYPTTIRKGSTIINIASYSTDVALPLGRMFDLALEIVNAEITEGHFDKDEWMRDHGSSIRIKKMRPYPDILYKLIMLIEGQGKEYEFVFALQGEDTVSRLSSKVEPSLYPYCEIPDEKNCFANVEPILCVSKGGSSTSNPQFCGGSTQDFGDSECLGGVCNDCVNFGRTDGETWCEYDGITGKGTDRVGSRHTQMSCHNGKLYVEECRDYREGICTEPVNGEAVCRPNRWEDCLFQTTRQACHDDDVRDCYWNGDLELRSFENIPIERRTAPNSLCMPEVPPGFKFWLGQGQQVCEMANEVSIFRQPIFETIGTIRAPQQWVASSAQYCGAMGDCGDGRNLAGVKPTYTPGPLYWRNKRFYNSEMEGLGHPLEAEGVYGQESYSHRFRLGLRNDVFNKIFGMFYLPSHDQGTVLTQLLAFSRIAGDWKACQAFKCKKVGFIKIPKKPYHESFKQYLVGASVCNVWETRNIPNICGACSLDPLKTCTEYRCKSLGPGCFYNFNASTGRGRCSDVSIAIENQGPLNAEFIKESLPDDFSSQEVEFFDKRIFDIVEPIKPDEGFQFTFNTSREASCTASILPGLDANNVFSGFGQHLLGTCDLGQKCFEVVDQGKEHIVKINMQDNEAYRRRLNDILDINTVLQLFDPTLTTVNFGGFTLTKNEFVNFVSSLLSLPPAKGRQFLLEYLLLYDARKNLLFFRCIDTFGKLDVDNLGVLFEIFPQDNVAPTVDVPPANVVRIPLLGTITDLSFSFTPSDNRPSVYCSYTLEHEGDIIVEESEYVRTGEAFVIDVDPPERGGYDLFVTCSDGLQDVSGGLTANIV